MYALAIESYGYNLAHFLQHTTCSGEHDSRMHRGVSDPLELPAPPGAALSGTVEVLAGAFAGQGITAADFGRFLAITTLGGVVVGVVFVAILKFAHATPTTAE
jgi:hypothetical protein